MPLKYLHDLKYKSQERNPRSQDLLLKRKKPFNQQHAVLCLHVRLLSTMLTVGPFGDLILYNSNDKAHFRLSSPECAVLLSMKPVLRQSGLPLSSRLCQTPIPMQSALCPHSVQLSGSAFVMHSSLIPPLNTQRNRNGQKRRHAGCTAAYWSGESD